MHSRRYSAFISYRHADNTQEGRRWAEWLHRALERYVVPPDLIGTPNLRGEPIRDSLYPIFRDEDELPANADLATGIRAALEVSDHLIVLCSPRSAVSPWVRKEVREFKELGRSDHILAIIIAGEPNADDPVKAREGILRDEECFCEELRFGAVRDDGTLDWTLRTEPLAADLRPVGTRAEGFVTAEAYREYLTLNSSLTADRIASRVDTYRQQLDHGILKVVAGLLGVPLSQLIDRDAAHRANLARKELLRVETEAARLRASNHRLAMTVAVALAFAAVAGWFWLQSNIQRDSARAAQTSEQTERKKAEKMALLANQTVIDAADQNAIQYHLGRRMNLLPIYVRKELAEDYSDTPQVKYEFELNKGVIYGIFLGKIGIVPCSGEVVVSQGDNVIVRSSFEAPQLMDFIQVNEYGTYTLAINEKNGNNANIEVWLAVMRHDSTAEDSGGKASIVEVDFGRDLRAGLRSAEFADIKLIESSGWGCSPIEIDAEGRATVETKENAEIGFYFISLSKAPLIAHITNTNGALVTTSFVIPHMHLRLGVLSDQLISKQSAGTGRCEVRLQLLYEDGTPFSGSVEALFTSRKSEVLTAMPTSHLQEEAKTNDRIGRSQEKVTAQPTVSSQVVITEVIKGGQADALGLKTGDAFIGYNGQNITSVEQIIQLTDEAKGEAIPLEVLRDGKKLTFTVKPGKLGTMIENRPLPLATRASPAK